MASATSDPKKAPRMRSSVGTSAREDAAWTTASARMPRARRSMAEVGIILPHCISLASYPEFLTGVVLDHALTIESVNTVFLGCQDPRKKCVLCKLLFALESTLPPTTTNNKSPIIYSTTIIDGTGCNFWHASCNTESNGFVHLNDESESNHWWLSHTAGPYDSRTQSSKFARMDHSCGRRCWGTTVNGSKNALLNKLNTVSRLCCVFIWVQEVTSFCLLDPNVEKC